ncbi:hypothetical protein C8F01DRAFT_1214206 [Mycena amicta]|nr:hypothetical protein C8F01DRAFT_1214206 [Mycena amicta]
MPPRDAFYFGEEDEAHFEADEGFDLSADGHRLRGRLINVEERVQHQRDASPSAVESDQYAGWVALEGEELGAGSSLADSDNPNALWRPLIPTYLDALLRHDGLGDYVKKLKCGFCNNMYGDESTRVFRCQDCGEFLQCKTCLCERHTLSPLHRIQEWNGDFWTEASLHKSASGFGEGLGLVYQLGHHGFPCPLPEPKRRLVVLNVGGVFILDVNYCGCMRWKGEDHVATCATYWVLEQFRLMSVVGNANVHDFVGCLERMTDPTLSGSVPRGGGHELSGVTGTSAGELAVPCWACPLAGFNLPEGWESRAEGERYNERHDPSFGSGWSYFVETEAYKNHLRNYTTEDDVSSCIAFAALTQKDTRITTGLRISGGRRVYANMDYILLSALRFANVKRLVLSYDIACQWKLHLLERADALAEANKLPTHLEIFNIAFALPVWHAVAHEPTCQVENSLSYLKGVGRTDGEGIERTWAVLNPVSYATKEMGEGNRHDSIDDKIDHINFEKNIRQGKMLSRKLIVAISERDKQTQQFEEMDESLNDATREAWRTEIEQWERDRSMPNPFLMHGGQKSELSEAQILAALKKDELDELWAGRVTAAEGKMTLAGFIKAKLQLEDLQDRIQWESRSKTLTADRASQLDELRMSFFKKLHTITKLEEVFMPAAVDLRAEDEELHDPEVPPKKAEEVPLWLPSELSKEELKAPGMAKLARIESSLRRGQCGDTIARLRGRIHAATHLSLFRKMHIVGQRHNTRQNTLWERIEEKKQRDARKYRRAFRAMVWLEGSEFAPKFQELRNEDMSNRTEEEESDAAARAKLGRAGGRHVRTEPALAKHATRVSWIWFVGGDADAGEVHDAVRVQWSKARARCDRWTEEVLLLREEMKRVLRSLVSVEEVWRQRAGTREVAERGLANGLRAYALRQAAVYRRIADGFYTAWSVGKTGRVETNLRKHSGVNATRTGGCGIQAAG